MRTYVYTRSTAAVLYWNRIFTFTRAVWFTIRSVGRHTTILAVCEEHIQTTAAHYNINTIKIRVICLVPDSVCSSRWNGRRDGGRSTAYIEQHTVRDPDNIYKSRHSRIYYYFISRLEKALSEISARRVCSSAHWSRCEADFFFWFFMYVISDTGLLLIYFYIILSNEIVVYETPRLSFVVFLIENI